MFSSYFKTKPKVVVAEPADTRLESVAINPNGSFTMLYADGRSVVIPVKHGVVCHGGSAHDYMAFANLAMVNLIADNHIEIQELRSQLEKLKEKLNVAQ